MVSALGMSESALSIENRQTSRSATTPQRSGMTHFGAFLRTTRSTSTARMSQLALMLRFTSFKKMSSMMILLSVKVDHFLHLVKLFVAHVARLCKRGDERGQRAVEALVEQLVDLGGLRLVL